MAFCGSHLSNFGAIQKDGKTAKLQELRSEKRNVAVSEDRIISRE